MRVGERVVLETGEGQRGLMSVEAWRYVRIGEGEEGLVLDEESTIIVPDRETEDQSAGNVLADLFERVPERKVRCGEVHETAYAWFHPPYAASVDLGAVLFRRNKRENGRSEEQETNVAHHHRCISGMCKVFDLM